MSFDEFAEDTKTICSLGNFEIIGEVKHIPLTLREAYPDTMERNGRHA